MKEKQDNWQRIEAVIKWANMSINYFARHIGLARGENLYQIKRGNNGISLDVAERIVSKFPQIDKLWLLTGEGQMFSDKKLRGVQIPYYHYDPEQSVSELATLEPESYLLLPMLQQCDFAMCYTGRAMGGVIPTESVVLFRTIDRSMIIPGDIYLIRTPRMSMLRIVRTTPDENRLRLVPGDKENYDDVMVDISDVTDIYKLVGKLIFN